jgi:hypothetical protein
LHRRVAIVAPACQGKQADAATERRHGKHDRQECHRPR